MTGTHWDFLMTLVCCVRAFTINDQAQRFTGIWDAANFRRWLKPLEAHGFVEVVTVLAKPVPEMLEPLLTYFPTNAGGDRKGPLDDLAGFQEELTGTLATVLRLARARWAGLSAAPVRVCIATKRGGNLFGVSRTGEVRKALKATHDLLVSQTYLTRRNEKINQGEHWIGEDCAAVCLKGVTPDAVIVDAENVAQKIIEIVGADYDEARLLRIHEECRAAGLAYELW